jgi:hypothetical protein
MTFKTFAQLDDEAGSNSLFFDYAKQPTRPDLAGYATPEMLADAQEMASRSALAAAFRQDNTIASIMTRKDLGIDNEDDPNFDPVTYVQENNLTGYEDSFIGIMNARRADAVKAQIEMEQRDRETLAASGWAGTLAQIAAGTFDAPILIPGSVAVRGARGAWSVGRSALMAGTAAGATQAVTEGVLQTVQETRTAEESFMNIGAATVMGSLLGSGLAAVYGKNERITAMKALESLADAQTGVKTFIPSQVLEQRPATAGGADVPEGAFFVDPIDKARMREELSVEGAAAAKVVQATSEFNANLRATQRYAASARQIGNVLYANTIYRAMHSMGETTGPSIEAMMRVRVSSLQAEAATAAGAAYKEMRKQKIRMREDDFYAEVGKAMRNDDMSDNQFVARAAQSYRKMFDEFAKDALKLGLFKEGDMDVKTAASYFSRFYDLNRLKASEPEFLDLIGKWFARQMQEEYATEAPNLLAVKAKYKQQMEDISLTGAERSARVGEIFDQGAKLDEEFAEIRELVSDLNDAQQRARTGDAASREAAREEAKQLMVKGGEPLQKYLTRSRALRGRMRNLRERNPDAQAARYEAIMERIDEAQSGVERSLAAFGRRAKNLLNKIEADPVAKAQSKLADIEKEAMKVQQLIERTQERVARMAERGDAEQAAPALDRLQAQEQRLFALTERLAERDAGVAAAKELVAEIESILEDVTKATAAATTRSGERIAKLKERAGKLSPEEVSARAEKQKKQFEDTLLAAEKRFDAKWGPRTSLGIEKNEAYDFEAAGRLTAKDVYDNLTGKTPQREDIPSFVTMITTGPHKERSFLVPDALLAGQKWLVDDVRLVAERYARAMAGEAELTRRFGRADMSDQLSQISKEYSELRVAADRAKTIDELNAVLGRDKYNSRRDLADAKLDAQKILTADEESAIRDTKAGRDMIRGVYGRDVNSTGFASILRSAMHFNYVTNMGGVLVSSLPEFYRPAMVHGLMPFMKTVPTAIAQAFGKGRKGLQMSMREAKMSGLINERVSKALQAANGDVADPYLSKTTSIERFMQKASRVASSWNLINAFTDAQQTIASTVSQHRILEAILGNAGKDGSFVTKVSDGERLIRMLGIDRQTQKDIAEFFAKHGEVIDDFKIPNTQEWLRVANESGVPEEIARAERAVRTYRAALNTDVNSIISRRGLGDAPLFANHPFGKLLTQFSGYAMGAHGNVTIRGMQEGHAKLAGHLIVSSLLGSMSAVIVAWRGGQERFDRYMKSISDNPAVLIGDGLERSGFFSLFFDVASRVERTTGAAGYQYRFNPIKSPIVALGGGASSEVTATRGSEGAGVLGAFLGPTAGLATNLVAAGRVAADVATGKEPFKKDINQAIAVVPYQSYYGAREMLQVLTGNSTYVRP